MKWLTSTIRNPVGLVLTVAVFAVCLSSYPIIFFGKSYVSPGYGPQMIYDDLPYVPGYRSMDKENLPADPGAMPWQNLPYSRVQHQAVFEHGEFPLWNRYNSAGLPLFGQGQSQFLDPLHWIAVAGEGNGWAWDLKFLLSKLVFLAGIGACVFLMTGNRVVTITITVSAAFIGFFYFRFNHPSYFTLTYAPWVLFFYLQLVQTLKCSDKGLQVVWRWLPVSGIFFASIFLLFAGTPKESTILFAALHFSGFVGVVAASLKSRKLVANLGLLISLWIAIALASAPHWLIFMDTLSKVSTVSDVSSCSVFSLLEDSWILIDTLFLGSKSIPWGEPNTNTFIFFGVALAVVASSHLFRKSGFLMTVLPLTGLLCFSFGIVPDSVCQRIPFVGKIHHVNHTFLAATIPFLILLSAIGFNWIFVESTGVVRRFRSTFMVLLIGFLLVVLLSVKNTNSVILMNPASLLALLSIGGVTVLLLLVLWTRSFAKGFSCAIATVSLALFASAHGYHGLHIKSGWKELDDLLINPTPRADFLKPSPAVNSLGYLLPSKSFETDRYKVGSADICSVSASGLAFEGYVNKYPDLFTAYNANPGGKSKSEWGWSHYCKFGRNKGRTYPGQVEKSVIEAILDRAVKAGGVESEIQRYKSLLRENISSSPEPLIMQRHAANFLRRVGTKRWLDDPVRVIGEGRTPMSGFYSYLKLESLNGPDALMSKNYLQFLDLMGWRLPPRESWHRTMGIEDFEKLEPLLDVLNVGYLMSWKHNLNTVHVVSEYTPYSDNEKITGEPDLAQEELWLSLRRIPVIADRVDCRSKGLQSDGRADSVFVADINLPNLGLGKVGTISALRLERIRPFGVNQTGGRDYVLGVSKGIDAPLLNHSNGSVQISVSRSNLRLWLFSCADGHDQTVSEYRVRIAYERATQLPLVFDGDMKIWEREHPWPRAFFVDSFATYTEISEFARFVRQAEGVPLAAIEGNRVIEPHPNRVILAAQNYELTSNSTSFRVEAPSSGVVVLSEVNIPGDVHVQINHQSGKVFNVNHTFRGVEIPKAGDYEIIFTYRPKLWNVALMLSAGGHFIVLIMVIIFLRNKRVHSQQIGGKWLKKLESSIC